MSRLTTHLAQYETIKRFALLADDFTFDSGSLTFTMKLKRRVVEKQYHDLIAKLYADVTEPRPVASIRAQIPFDGATENQLNRFRLDREHPILLSEFSPRRSFPWQKLEQRRLVHLEQCRRTRKQPASVDDFVEFAVGGHRGPSQSSEVGALECEGQGFLPVAFAI